MKKLINFLRSMTFGVILLIIISIISVAGSLIEQGQHAMYYVNAFPQYYQIIFALKLDHVFSSWYFIVIVVMLCLNLTLCSILRFRRVSSSNEIETAALATSEVMADAEQLQKVRRALERQHCRKTEINGRTVYSKNSFGRYGTFLVHLGILLTVIFFFTALQSPKITDQTCYPGEAITMEDGTTIAVESFRIEDETGKLDFASEVNVTLPDGRSSGIQETSVNHPVAFGKYKVYQQTYGTTGVITVTDELGNKDSIIMEDHMFLSKDGVTGVWYNTVYPDFVQGESGAYSLITSTSGRYPNPVYTFNQVVYADDEGEEVEMTPMLAFPGDEIEIGELHFRFEEVLEYPGLRIKESAEWVNIMRNFICDHDPRLCCDIPDAACACNCQ